VRKHNTAVINPDEKVYVGKAANHCVLLFSLITLAEHLKFAGSNTSIVALQVVGGDEKENQCLGGITGPPCFWGI
jgi:hypothetical protein